MEKLGFVPDRIVAGETIWIAAANTIQNKTDITLTDYTPAGGYTLAYQFAASTPITVTAVANGTNTGWTLEVTAAQTLVWKGGVINYAGIVTLSSRSYAVDTGTIQVEPSPLSTSSWTAIVTAVDAAILTYAASPSGSFSVDGMSFTYKSLKDLTDLRSYAKSMEQLETGSRIKRIIRTRFT